MARTDLEQLVFQLSADVNKMSRNLERGRAKVRQEAGLMNRDLDGVGRKFGVGLKATVDDLGRSFGGLSTTIPGVSAGLGAVGVAGGAAAGALALLAVAGTQAFAAMNYADELDDAAAKVGVNVEALQEWRHAVQAAGGQVTDADEALGKFTKTLGAATSGLSEKALKGFKALGFTQEQLKSYDNVDAAMMEVIRRIGDLRSESERATVAEKTGLGAILPLIRMKADAVVELREEARKLGIVMDEALVKKGAEAAEKFRTASQVIRNQLMSAFVDLSPRLVKFAEQLGAMLGRLNAFLNARDEASIGVKLEKIRANQAQRDGWQGDVMGAKPYNDRILQLSAEVRQLVAERNARATAGAAVPATPIQEPDGTSLIDPSGGVSTRRRATSEPHWSRSYAFSADEMAAGFETVEQEAARVAAALDLIGPPLETFADTLQSFWTKADPTFEGFQVSKNPLQQYAADVAVEAENAGENLQRLAVDGLEALSYGLADAIMNAESLGDVASNVFRQILAEVLAMTIRQSITGPIASMLGGIKIPGFAAGTMSAPGGLAVVGERGPELVNLPKGSQVIPNHLLRAGTLSRPTPIVTQSFHLHAENAVLAETVVGQMRTLAAQAKAQAIGASLEAVRKGGPALQNRQQMLGTR